MENGTQPSKPSFAVSFPPTPHGIPVGWARAAGVLVLASLIVQHGFPVGGEVNRWLNWLDVFLALCFGFDLLFSLKKARYWKSAFVARRVEFFVLILFGVTTAFLGILPFEVKESLLTFFRLESIGPLAFSLVKIYLLTALCIQLLRGTQRLFGKGVRPELILGGSFAVLILIGSFLLLLPNSSAKQEAPIGIIDAIFTSTSAACVTGLAVRDTGTDFSIFGQTVILGLFQMGGLGIITFVAFLSVFSTRALPVPQMVAFRQIVNAPAASDLRRQIIGILLTAAAIEVTGIVLIYQMLPGDSDPLSRIFWSVFHAVSAFCNAGFALQADSLESFQSHPGLMFTFMGLIIFGGLGFLVISELFSFRWSRMPIFRRVGFLRRLHSGSAPSHLTVQTKLSVIVTLLLLVIGFVMFWVLEFNHILHDKTVGESFLISAFQSVTPRTAGFNTIPFNQLQDVTLIFVMVLMVIGANPVSTGGGIKTASFGILILALRAMIARRDRVEAFGRTLPVKTLFAALSVFVIYVISAAVGIFLLALFDPQMKLQDQAFEVISALSTVGLSTGITSDLSPASKIVLCVAMFVGRVGPISLVLSVFHKRRTLAYEFPEEEVVVG